MVTEWNIRALLEQSLEEEGTRCLEEFAQAEVSGTIPPVSKQTQEACKRMNRLRRGRTTSVNTQWKHAAVIALTFLLLLGATGTVLAAMQLQTIYQRFTEHLSVDAMVEDHIGESLPAIYTAEPMCFTTADADRMLACLGDSTQKWEVQEESASATTEAEGKMYLQNGMRLQYLSRNYLDWYYRYPIYYGQASADSTILGEQRLYERFTQSVQLSFGSSQEAEQAVRELLSDMGLEQLSLRRVLYITPERMEQLDEDLRANKLEVKHNCTPQQEPWRQEQACYAFEFVNEFDSCPLTLHSWKRAVYGFVNGVMVWYGQDGILNLTINGAWKNPERQETAKSIISAEDAVNVVRDAYLFPTESNREITHVELVYLHDLVDGSWLLKPVWEVTLHVFPTELVDQDLWYYFQIDAVTGQKIGG